MGAADESGDAYICIYVGKYVCSYVDTSMHVCTSHIAYSCTRTCYESLTMCTQRQAYAYAHTHRETHTRTQIHSHTRVCGLKGVIIFKTFITILQQQIVTIVVPSCKLHSSISKLTISLSPATNGKCLLPT